MRTLAQALLAVDILNLLAFAILEAIAAAHHHHQPWPRWLRRGALACFYSALFLFLVSLHCLASRTVRKQALLSAILAIASAFLIALLIGRG